MGKLISFIVGREPVVAATGLAGVVTATLGALEVFDLVDITPEQIAAVAVLVTALAGWLARAAVTPVAKASHRGHVMTALWLAIFAVLVACGDGGPDSTGNNDTILTGLSGVVILAVVAWFAFRHFNKKGNG